ncbi:MucBP domain-containing protein [Ligilactobacillus salivarius]|uniref:MucBP domain-containing protein n=8 Tax=Ligilactobacillus salivarius TaxID=1624 RepID=UPI00136A5FE3|nr:LPXTG cell wall anchor domain-containing protein [Ligilactobacillus salivarius]MYZ03333.1 LPXTG cell wall anchor domain-containing protein [Ligilactobacillus salivarius]MYZ71843.1 LPXTG cell wall anchor domain-containing protein [Ligilactobacillus salivarius]MYZ77374.1 LPXTG cell wall anchor domain-containing protein [Ligilactobacillus salivarius]
MSRNNLNRKLKYSIRKKKNGGGAASFIVGSVVLGGLMLGGATTVNADEVTSTGTDSSANTSAASNSSTDISGEKVVLSSSSPSSSETQPTTNKTQPTTSATSESTSETTTTPARTAGNTTSESNTDTSATTNDGNNVATAQPTAAKVVKKVSAMAPSQSATNKVSISNVRLNKSVVKESDGTDLTINYDWEAKGLHQGDTMVTPMFEGFDSIYKQVNFPIMSDGLKIGTLRLDYDQRKIFTIFTADLDPDKIYRGHMEVGTFVSRDYFKNLNNKIVVQIPLPNGTTIEKPLTVIFDKAPSFTDSYEQATKYVMSDDDKTQADVSWAVLINPQGEEMQQPTIYLTTNEITNLNNVYGQARLSYATPASPSTLDPRSIKLYEAQIYPSLGYTKGKQLTLGVDYEITKGDIDDMGRNVKDVWLVKLKGDYLTTNGQFVVEYNTHYDHLNPNASSGDSGAAVKTEVTNNGVLAYQNVNNQLGGGLFGATVNLIDSGVTLKDPETPTPEVKKGNVDVTYVAEDGTVLEATTDVVKDGEVGTDYTTEKKKFDGYSFSRMGEFSAEATGKVEEGTKHVVYVYTKNPEEKKGNVDVKYITTDGKVLEDVTSVKENAPVGEDYTTEEKTFDGYHFVGMDKTSDPATGVVAEGTKHVVYVYEKDVTPEVKKGSVDVKYVTTDGKVLEDVTKVKDNAPVGEAYTTEEKSFDGYHFVGMDKTSDSANGKVTEGDKHVVYVYEKDPEVPTTPVEKKGSVYVKYVDENGNELPGGEKTTVVKDGNVGSYYFTTEKDFDGYTFSHMAEGSSNPTGKVVEGDQQVVYVYTKNNTPQPEPNKPEVPTTPETPAVPQEEKTTTDTPVKTSTSKVNAEKVTVNKATVLPQTGDKKENNSSVMGLVSLGLAGLLGLGIKRKEEKDNH